jgi:predicted nucleic acid-binding protein
MIYLDTSCLLKLLFEEPESAKVRQAVDTEQQVIISSLTELEAELQLQAAMAGGRMRRTQWRKFLAQLAGMRNLDPFHFKPLPAGVFSAALRQHRHPQSIYCRTLDRLHLAAVEELGLGRLMTLDIIQGNAAQDLGFEVVRPGS